MPDFHLSNWRWERERYGPAEALRSSYPSLLRGHHLLRTAVTQIELAEAAIDKIMSDLERAAIGEEDDD